MEGFSFVTPVTGLNRPNTGKEDDDDDSCLPPQVMCCKTAAPICLGQAVPDICFTANYFAGMKEDNLWYLPWVVRPALLHGTQYFVSPSLGVIRRRRRNPLSTSVSGK
jgi:hypothetical protein